MEKRLAKFRIYKDILCLEMAHDANMGAKFWDQGFGLGYTPAPVQAVSKVRYGVVRGVGESAGRRVLAAWYEGQWVAVNLPRSDVAALQARGMWPAGVTPPYDEVVYAPLPYKG